jgi:biofilm protein TabA
MFLSTLTDLDRDARFLPSLLVKGLTYLRDADLSSMVPGKYEISGSDLFALVQEYRTKPKAEKKAESHVRYLDVQYLHDGVEIIGFAPAGGPAEILEDAAAEKDVITYKTAANETDLVLTKGMYAVLFPGEIHRPQCSCGADGTVKKVVLKVAMAAFLNAR